MVPNWFPRWFPFWGWFPLVPVFCGNQSRGSSCLWITSSGRGNCRAWMALARVVRRTSLMPRSFAAWTIWLRFASAGKPCSSSRLAHSISSGVNPVGWALSRIVVVSPRSSTMRSTWAGHHPIRLCVRMRVRPSVVLSSRYTMSTSSFLADEPRWPSFLPPSLPAWSVRTQAMPARLRASPVVLANSRYESAEFSSPSMARPVVSMTTTSAFVSSVRRMMADAPSGVLSGGRLGMRA